MGNKLSSLGRDDLIERYRGYVAAIANRLVARLTLPQELQPELVSAGYVGLVEAAERFDGELGCPFQQYAYLRIRGAMIDSLRKSSELSAQAYRYAKALEAANELREDELRQSPSSDADTLLAQTLEFAARGALTYRLVCSGDELDQMQVDHRNPEGLLERKQLHGRLREIIARLPEKEGIVIREYYFAGKTFSEIGREQGGWNKSWVSRLHTRAIERLRNAMLDCSNG